MILQTAQEIASKYNQSVRKNDYRGFTLESNDNPDLDYRKFSGYEFKNLDRDTFEQGCLYNQIDWQPDKLQWDD